jgi:phosphoadenosine phosphosulfate reductase
MLMTREALTLVSPLPLPAEPAPELAAEIDEQAIRLDQADPEAILGWAADRFGSGLTMATAFGVEGCLILHFLSRVAPKIRVFNLDTGYQFAETLNVRDRIREKYGIDVELVQPSTTVAEYEAEHGGPLYRHRPDQCCYDRKVVPLRRAVAGYTAWISGIRAEETDQRSRGRVIQWDGKFGLTKINPLLNWNRKRVWSAVISWNVPYNSLHDRGYESIGCEPCTVPGVGREGRWGGMAKKECGLHVQEHEQGSGI